MTAAMDLVTPSVGARVGDDAALLLGGPAGAESLADHDARLGRLPGHDGDAVIDLVENAGLCGRGGAQFPLARKLATVRQHATADRRPIVVVNVSESEPASRKDHTLATLRPHLLLDGAALACRALGVDRATLHVHADGPTRALQVAVRERELAGRPDPRWTISVGPARYVAGEQTAVLSHLAGGPPLPQWSPVPAAISGLHGRPTLISNAETLAQLAVLARIGPDEWRQRGPGPWTGPILLTLQGGVAHPGAVVEVHSPATIGAVLGEHGGLDRPSAAVLVGGYAGTWLPGDVAWRTVLDRTALTAVGASIGCGALVVLPDGVCGLAETARIADWLAGESAGQCGPCAFGLPRLGATFTALAGGRGSASELLRLAAAVEGRGGCRHPDGVARLVRSALTTFADDVRRHRRGRTCGNEHRELGLPLPRRH